tara:strand:+ start:1576 stop:3222 length:1647 start_codon:yes stop_codon:yes gene_type:complete
MTYIRPDKLRREKKIIRGTQPVTLTEKPNLKDYDDPWTDLSYEEVIERGHLIADLTLLERMEIDLIAFEEQVSEELKDLNIKLGVDNVTMLQALSSLNDNIPIDELNDELLERALDIYLDSYVHVYGFDPIPVILGCYEDPPEGGYGTLNEDGTVIMPNVPLPRPFKNAEGVGVGSSSASVIAFLLAGGSAMSQLLNPSDIASTNIPSFISSIDPDSLVFFALAYSPVGTGMSSNDNKESDRSATCSEMQNMENIPNPKNDDGSANEEFVLAPLDIVIEKMQRLTLLEILSKFFWCIVYFIAKMIHDRFHGMRRIKFGVGRLIKRVILKPMKKIMKKAWCKITGECGDDEESAFDENDFVVDDVEFVTTVDGGDAEGRGNDCVASAAAVMNYANTHLSSNSTVRSLYKAKEQRAYLEAQKHSVIMIAADKLVSPFRKPDSIFDADPSVEWQGPWVSFGTYKENEGVEYNEIGYVSIKNNNNNNPPPDSEWWISMGASIADSELIPNEFYDPEISSRLNNLQNSTDNQPRYKKKYGVCVDRALDQLSNG